MEHFTPISSLIGGVLIGLSASILLLGAGRVCGIAGIVGQLVTPPHKEPRWRLAFLGGMLAGGLGAFLVHPAAFRIETDSSFVSIAVAGLLVGFGTRLGNGCTSGHGVCGLSRLSLRSLAATLTFIATGAATTYLARHVLAGRL